MSMRATHFGDFLFVESSQPHVIKVSRLVNEKHESEIEFSIEDFNNFMQDMLEKWRTS